MIEAIIFDMDGLLIDSEPGWNQARKGMADKVGLARFFGLALPKAFLLFFQLKPAWVRKVLKLVRLTWRFKHCSTQIRNFLAVQPYPGN